LQYLKYKFGWTDKTENKNEHSGTVNITGMEIK